MDNELTHHILDACDRFAQKEILLDEFQARLDAIASALEGRPVISRQMRAAINDLERVRFACLAEQQYEAACKIAELLRNACDDISPSPLAPERLPPAAQAADGEGGGGPEQQRRPDGGGR